MKLPQVNSMALFMALALTAAPISDAFAGTARGGSPRASTDEHAQLKTGESATAETTVETPVAANVNIQPGVRDGDTVKADAAAQAKLHGNAHGNHSADMKSDNSTAAKTANDPDAPMQK